MLINKLIDLALYYDQHLHIIHWELNIPQCQRVPIETEVEHDNCHAIQDTDQLSEMQSVN